jgi:hypothetical protein
MKANEAPEKIYVRVKDGKAFSIWNSEWVGVNDIEYTCTDAFIKKAEEWLRNKQRGFILTDKDITDFVNDMKGE